MVYKLEQRIHTLAQNDVENRIQGTPTFSVNGITLSAWKDHPGDDWWTHPYWFATGEIDATDFRKAWVLFWDKLAQIVPRMSLISQCYAEYLTQPILIHREDSDAAFLRYSLEREGVGLMFMEQEQKALDLLMTDARIPVEFFWYWNDATNSSGYTSRIVLMLAAVETLVNKPNTGKGRPEKDWEKLNKILGPELRKIFWGEEGSSSNALRHRLIHGRYFESGDGSFNHRALLYKSVIRYFNKEIFKEDLLDEDITNPQRHPFGNRDEGQSFIRSIAATPLTLPRVLVDMNGKYNLTDYERIVDSKLWTEY